MSIITQKRVRETIGMAMMIVGFLGLHGNVAAWMLTFDPAENAYAARLLLTAVIMGCGAVVAFGRDMPTIIRRGSFLLLSYAAFLGFTAAIHYLRGGWPNGEPDTYNQVIYLGATLIAIGTLAVTRRQFWH